MFLSVKENRFVANGAEILLKGVGLGNWLNLEHFLLGIPGTEREIRNAVLAAYGAEAARKFWRTYYKNCVGEADIRFAAELGFNCVRLPVNAHAFTEGPSFEETTAAAELDRAISLCAAQKIFCVIDLHAAFGGQNPDWHSDNTTGDYPFFKDEKLRRKTVNLWEQIALRYKDNPWVGGYDLLNEPCYFEKSYDKILIRFYADCIERIRGAGDRHIIFLEGGTYARDFSMFKTDLDADTAYTFHYYPFLQLPDGLDKPGRLERLKASLYADVTLSYLQDRLGKPLWCGETGHPLHLPESVDALGEFLDLLEEMDISWSLWPHKDARAMGLCYLSKNSAYLSLVRKASDNWSFWNIFNQDSMLSVRDESDKHQFYRVLAADGAEACRRFSAALKQIPFADFLGALEDWKFDNCERNEALLSCFIKEKKS